MKAIVVGCGRVGSTRRAAARPRQGWDVEVVDEREEALDRLGEHWSGGFVVGHGMDVGVLEEAGIEEADAVVVATNGDNTNLVVGRWRRSGSTSSCVVVRILDPARAKFYATAACDRLPDARRRSTVLTDAVRSRAVGRTPTRRARCSSSSRAEARSARTSRARCSGSGTR